MIILLVLACAKEGMPPGGPIDEIPPEVIQAIPESGATGVDPDVTVQVWFSERIEPKSASDAIFISPFVGKNVKYQFRGRRLKIVFSKPLEANLTYVITLGTGIKDYRNNAMETSYSLAFSTGPVVDQGKIMGQVYGLENAAGIDVWAYALGDSIESNPSMVEPKYIVQCEAMGGFTFSHIAPGSYRLFAVRDRMADRLYQPGEDEVGVTDRDVFLPRSGTLTAAGFRFRMALEDTAGPSIVRAVSLDRHHVTLRLDEPVSSDLILSSRSLAMVAAEDTLDSLSFSYAYADPMGPQTIHILTQAQTDGKRYRLSLQDLWDEAGNLIDTAFSVTHFTGVGMQDTTIPKLLLTEPAPGEKLVNLRGKIRLVFNEALDTTGFNNGISLQDTLGVNIPGTIHWGLPTEVIFHATERLNSNTTYEVGLSGHGIRDLAGNALADTVYRFQTVNRDTLSEIQGSVVDADTHHVGSIYITAQQIGDSGIQYSETLAGPGAYRFIDVMPGQYLLACFRDRDGNGRYTMGSPFPFEPSERFVVYRDTVKVRSKWPNEGNDIVFSH